MMNNLNPVINFEDVAVRYRVPREGISGIKEYSIRLLQRRIQYEEFWALRGVSFQVNGGDVFGIIGRNGAGKSTMLKVMARVLQPTRGRVVMDGHTAPLLELGGGFHHELTGRENIFLNMALLGFNHRQITELFHSVVEFSEIPEFIDAPLRTYSTGMIARLGFSVATCQRPEILLVDEVLSVGDVQFQQKCLDRMISFRQSGTTIVIVSHDLGTVQSFCDQVMWLDHGEVQAIGDPEEVIDKYIHTESPEQVPSEIELSGEQEEFVELDPKLQVYSAHQIFSPGEGTVTAWVKISRNNRVGTAVIFHTDDSRFVLYTQIQVDRLTSKPYYQFTGRAGGNQRAPDHQTGKFPEVSTNLFMEENTIEQWVHLAMTWKGFPEGKLHLFLDGKPIGEHSYSKVYNDDQPMPTDLSVGMRPLTWSGERVLAADGSYTFRRPESKNSIYDAQLELQNIHIYKNKLTPEAISALHREGQTAQSELNRISGV
jgi:ABC-type polysaccharide/polyol phosphate transport system ATPase subunit